jgi:hypothetical protein
MAQEWSKLHNELSTSVPATRMRWDVHVVRMEYTRYACGYIGLNLDFVLDLYYCLSVDLWICGCKMTAEKRIGNHSEGRVGLRG